LKEIEWQLFFSHNKYWANIYLKRTNLAEQV